MDKAIARLLSIVDGIVDKKLGAFARETGEKLENMREDMENNNKELKVSGQSGA